MKRGGLVLLLAFILFLPVISSSSIDSEIQKITSYAEDYETGNINYVQLLVYTSSSREKMNNLLGVSGKEYGGILKQEQIESILGEPNERTRWVWVEGLENEAKFDSDIPIWKKIIFDGKKIQIKLNAYPSVFFKTDFKTEEEKMEFKKEQTSELNNKKFTEGDIIYRLNIEISFKKPQDQLDIAERIKEIQVLANDFNSDPSNENAEELAKAGVDAEKLFWNYFEQSPGKCEDLMSSIFGSENKKEKQNLLIQEIDFYEGETFQATARLEMCDDCGSNNWINLDMQLDTRGRNKPLEETKKVEDQYSKDKYKSMGDEYFKSEISKTLDGIKKSLDEGDYNGAFSSTNELRMLNNAWNEKGNNIWEGLDKIYRLEEQSMTNEERQKLSENYGWIKREQERKKNERELIKENYEVRKQFYLDLFFDYDKKESYFTQIQFEKRLIEEFKEFGEEICNNNKDDNEDNNIDCADSQCGGKFCGKQTSSVSSGNETSERTIDLYCIAGVCQAKEEIIREEITICGNHICELNETRENCAEDCSTCQTYDALNCSGKVIFSGVDINNCPLKPICIEESKSCTINEDCFKPLCGEVECIEGKCELTGLTECTEAQCTEGEKKVIRCQNGEELVNSICNNGLWNNLNVICPSGEISQNETTSSNEVVGEKIEEELLGNACSLKEDCGNADDVCSNGRCVTIPEIVKVVRAESKEVSESSKSQEKTSENVGEESSENPQEIAQESGQQSIGEESSESVEKPSEKPQEEAQESSSESPVTGSVVLGLFKKTMNNFALTITGLEIEGESEEEPEAPPEEPPAGNNPEPPQKEEDSNNPENSGGQEHPNAGGESFPANNENSNVNPPSNNEDERKAKDERRQEEREADEDKRQQEEKERREKECDDQCNRICYDNKVRPCVENCIRESCGDSLDCDIDEQTKSCENKCENENNLDGCLESCSPKCLKGEKEWWREFESKPEENMHKMEKGVFNMGGNCRISQGKTEGSIWFGGWGEPFSKLEPLKQKYYSGGQTEWCKYELENLEKQRAEFEKGFNQEFVKWFFEDYLASSAEDWEQHVSGIFELYWKNVDNIRQTAKMMDCSGVKEFSTANLISVQYESEYGRIEYWEELKVVNMPEFDNKEVTIISPYMKFWIFPPKEFLKYEMKELMVAGEFPGSPEDKMERKNQEGLTEEEKQAIKMNEAFMNKIKKISEKYGGNLDLVVQLKDFETNEVVFNLYVQINENDIITVQPMLPEQIPQEDARIEVDFQEVYDLIYTTQKEMQGEQIQSPPWDEKPKNEGVKGVVDGVKMYFKVRSLLNSAKIYPPEAEGDVRDLIKTALKMVMKMGQDNGAEGGAEATTTEEQAVDKTVWEDLDVSSGSV